MSGKSSDEDDGIILIESDDDVHPSLIPSTSTSSPPSRFPGPAAPSLTQSAPSARSRKVPIGGRGVREAGDGKEERKDSSSSSSSRSAVTSRPPSNVRISSAGGGLAGPHPSSHQPSPSSSSSPTVRRSAESTPTKDLDFDPTTITLCWQGVEDSPPGSDLLVIPRPSSNTWTALLSHIRSVFHLGSLPIWLSDNHLQPVDSSTWQDRDYHRASTLLVYLESDRTIHRGYKKEVEHIPHFHLVTHAPEYMQAGSEGYPVLAYALGEFIDNALSAFRGRRERDRSFERGHISIHFMEPTVQWSPHGQMYILITDNGCGMNEGTLKSFARMADAPHSRGIIRNSALLDESNHYVNCSISQFGIGAKTAAFYLGESLSVSTYTGEPGAQVYELSLSEKGMKKRYDATGNAYRSELTARPVGAPHHCAWFSQAEEHGPRAKDVDETVKAAIKAEEVGQPFSRFLISGVRPELFKAVRDKADLLLASADMYDRQLHGPYGQGPENLGLNQNSEYHSPLISYRYEHQNSLKWEVEDLRTIQYNPQSQYSLLRKGPIFRCAVEFTPPATEGAVDIQMDRRARARIEIMYFPKELDGETHPDLLRASELEESIGGMEDEADATGAAGHNNRRGGRNQGGAAARSLQYSDEGTVSPNSIAAQVAQLRSQRSMCSLFWHGRLIPCTTTGPLYFMTAQSNEYKECLSRMKVNIFFAAPVLTDRVKLHFRQDMGELLSREGNGTPGDIRVEMSVDGKGQSQKMPRMKWLKESFLKQMKEWALLDANYQFHDVDFLESLSMKEELALFKKVELGRDGTVQAGDLVKVQLKGPIPHVFLRVLCVRREQRTSDYLRERQEAHAKSPGLKPNPVFSLGKVIGFVEPKEQEIIPNEFSHQMKDASSLTALFAQLPNSHRMKDLECRLAAKKLKLYSLKLLVKDLDDHQLRQEYTEYTAKARSTYPRSISVWATPKVELINGQVKQFRVKDHFPGSTVIAWTLEVGDKRRPVGGEKVRQTFYILPPKLHAVGGSGVEEEEKKQPQIIRSRSPRGQSKPRGRIPKVSQDAALARRDEDGSAAAEERYSSSGRRVVSRMNDLRNTLIIPQVPEPSRKKVKRGAAAAVGDAMEVEEKGGKKRRKTPGRPPEDVDMKEEEEEAPAAPEEEKRDLWGSHFDADVCAVDHAHSITDPHSSLDITTRNINGFTDKRFDKIGRYQVEYQLMQRYVPGDRDHVLKLTVTMEVYPGPPVVFLAANPHLRLDMKLGQEASAGLFLQAQDSYGNAITPKTMAGWKERAIDCPFTITCEEFPEWTISANPDIQPYHPTDLWVLNGIKVEPADLQALRFEDPARGLLLHCKITFRTLLSSLSSSAAVDSPVVSFVICLRPGDADRLDATSFPSTAVVLNTEPFPDFSLQLRDKFHQPTGIAADPDLQPEAFPLVHIWCSDPHVKGWQRGDIPPQRLSVNGHLHSRQFHLPPLSIDPQAMVEVIVPMSQQNEGTEDHFPLTIHLLCIDELTNTRYENQCSVSVTPRPFPSIILVYDPTVKAENPDYTSQWLLPPNAEVPLALKCVEESGAGWSMEDEEVKGENVPGWKTWLLPSVRKAIKVSVHGLLDVYNYPYEAWLNDLEGDRIPRLKMPQRVADKVLKCEVRIEFDEARVQRAEEGDSEEERQLRLEEDEQVLYLSTRLPFFKAFDIRVQFGSAVQWSAEVPSSLKCAAKWMARIQLFAVDRWGNKVATPETVGKPRVRIRPAEPAPDLDQPSLSSNQRNRLAIEESKEEKGGGEVAMEDDEGEAASVPIVLKRTEVTAIECWRSKSVRESAEDGGDDGVELDEWDHFRYPEAFLLMQPGPALLTVFDDNNKLLPSDDHPFLLEVGQPRKARAHLRDPVSRELVRLRQGLIVPARLLFDQLILTWFDRGWNPAPPPLTDPSLLLVTMEDAAIFIEDEGGHIQKNPYVAANEMNSAEVKGSTFPPFLCIYSKQAGQEEKGEEEKAGELLAADPNAEDLVGSTMRLRVMLWDAAQPEKAPPLLCSIPLQCCMLPYSISALTVTSLFPHRSPAEIERHRHLLSDAAIADLLRDEGSTVEIAGTSAPIIDVLLQVQPNESSLQYQLPSPDPSSLSLEWKFNNEPAHLLYQPAVCVPIGGVYRFMPKLEERKEGERGEGMRSVLNKAGRWSFRIVYKEQRPVLTQVLASSTKELTVDEDVLPAYPAALSVLGGDENESARPVVGNTASRVIARDVKLVVVDEFDDVVHFSSLSAALMAALKKIGWDVRPVEDRNAVAGGLFRRPPPVILSCIQVNAEEDCVIIRELAIEEKEGGAPADPGLYAVHFALPSPFALRSATLRFFFSPIERLREEKKKEEERLAMERQAVGGAAVEVQKRVDHLKTQIDALQGHLREWQFKADGVTQQEQLVLSALEIAERSAELQQLQTRALREAVQRYHHVNRTSAALVFHPFAELDSVLVDCLRQLESRYVRLDPVLRSTNAEWTFDRSTNRHLNLAEDGYYGQLASFLSVEDDRHCRLFSWFFASNLSNYIVTNRQCRAVDVLQTNAEGQVIRVQYEEGLTPILPLPPIPHTRLPPAVQSTITGNPRYFLNALHIRTDSPQVRSLIQQVLSDLVGPAIVVTSMDDATRYRQLLAQYGQRCPTMLALAEMKFLNKNNVEIMGRGSTAPPLTQLATRVGVETLQVKEWMRQVEACRTSAQKVRIDAEALQRSWKEGRWQERVQQLTSEKANEERRKQEMNERLRELGGMGWAPSTSSTSSPSSASSGVERNEHRRRQPLQLIPMRIPRT